MSQDNGNGELVVHVCDHCHNATDTRSALWCWAALTKSDRLDRSLFNHEKKDRSGNPQFKWRRYRGDTFRVHDTCKPELEAKAKRLGLDVVFWPSEELVQIWNADKVKRDDQKKQQEERDKLLVQLLRGDSSATPAPSTEVDETTVADETTRSSSAEATQAETPKEPDKASDPEAKAKEVRSFTERLAAHFNQEKAASL